MKFQLFTSFILSIGVIINTNCQYYTHLAGTKWDCVQHVEKTLHNPVVPYRSLEITGNRFEHGCEVENMDSGAKYEMEIHDIDNELDVKQVTGGCIKVSEDKTCVLALPFTQRRITSFKCNGTKFCSLYTSIGRQPLLDIWNEHKMPVGEVRQIVIQALAALSDMHNAGVGHLHIRPWTLYIKKDTKGVKRDRLIMAHPKRNKKYFIATPNDVDYCPVSFLTRSQYYYKDGITDFDTIREHTKIIHEADIVTADLYALGMTVFSTFHAGYPFKAVRSMTETIDLNERFKDKEIVFNSNTYLLKQFPEINTFLRATITAKPLAAATILREVFNTTPLDVRCESYPEKKLFCDAKVLPNNNKTPMMKKVVDSPLRIRYNAQNKF